MKLLGVIKSCPGCGEKVALLLAHCHFEGAAKVRCVKCGYTEKYDVAQLSIEAKQIEVEELLKQS